MEFQQDATQQKKIANHLRLVMLAMVLVMLGNGASDVGNGASDVGNDASDVGNGASDFFKSWQWRKYVCALYCMCS